MVPTGIPYSEIGNGTSNWAAAPAEPDREALWNTQLGVGLHWTPQFADELPVPFPLRYFDSSISMYTDPVLEYPSHDSSPHTEPRISNL